MIDSIFISTSVEDVVVATTKRARVYTRKALAARFWTKVDKDGPVPSHVPQLGPCWIWTGSCDARGYGGVRDAGRTGRLLKAHRVSWSMHFGHLTDWMIVCHRCDNPSCVRPERLFVGTQRDNAIDAVSKGRTCAKLHPERVARGERAGCVKLTAVQVQTMRDLAASGVSQVDLARQFKITQANVSSIVRRKTWR